MERLGKVCVNLDKEKILYFGNMNGMKTLEIIGESIGRSKTFMSQVISRGWIHTNDLDKLCNILNCPIEDIEIKNITEQVQINISEVASNELDPEKQTISLIALEKLLGEILESIQDLSDGMEVMHDCIESLIKHQCILCQKIDSLTDDYIEGGNNVSN